MNPEIVPSNIIPLTVGKGARLLRERRGLSIYEVSRIVGVDHKKIRAFERGRRDGMLFAAIQEALEPTKEELRVWTLGERIKLKRKARKEIEASLSSD